jgi:hypothetical protein
LGATEGSRGGLEGEPYDTGGDSSLNFVGGRGGLANIVEGKGDTVATGGTLGGGTAFRFGGVGRFADADRVRGFWGGEGLGVRGPPGFGGVGGGNPVSCPYKGMISASISTN